MLLATCFISGRERSFRLDSARRSLSRYFKTMAGGFGGDQLVDHGSNMWVCLLVVSQNLCLVGQTTVTTDSLDDALAVVIAGTSSLC